MLSVRLDKETEQKLNNLSQQTQRSKSFFVKDALNNYLDNMVDSYKAEIPNQTTLKALGEARNKQGKSFHNLDDLFADLEH
jgi:predicted DNA-binding protein